MNQCSHSTLQRYDRTVTHPTPNELLDFALGAPASGAEHTASHYSTCAECRAAVEGIRATSGLLSLESAGTRGPDCLDASIIASLVEGTITAAARSAAVSHLASCGPCREVATSVAGALTAPGIEREVAAIRRGEAPRRMLRLAIPLAAAAALILVVARPVQDWVGGVHRSPVVSQTTTPMPGAPVGAVSAATAIRWGNVPGADLYRVTVFDAAGSVLYEDQVTDTAVALPDSVEFMPGETYLWKVEARAGWDRWVASPLVRFHVEAALP